MLMLIMFYPVSSFSAVKIMTTRVVLNEKDNEQSFVIKNTGDSPSLLQLWLAEKEDESIEIKGDVPFTLSPPVSRINAQKSKVFRIISLENVSTSLPKDRESVFWINVLDAPSIKEGSEGSNKLNVAFRTRIKLFYRPVSLKGSPEESATRLNWTEKRSGNDYIYTVTNNEPYSVSFANFALLSGEKEVSELPGGMVGPYSTKTFSFKNVSTNNVKMKYQYITDLGAFVTAYYPK
ncbi:fimbrial chaperone protein [Erwinia tracheiphila PSU-1]|nr:fimbrial chaperone protein [Erwinia tracheiphila PSU-1]